MNRNAATAATALADHAAHYGLAAEVVPVNETLIEVYIPVGRSGAVQAFFRQGDAPNRCAVTAFRTYSTTGKRRRVGSRTLPALVASLGRMNAEAAR